MRLFRWPLYTTIALVGCVSALSVRIQVTESRQARDEARFQQIVEVARSGYMLSEILSNASGHQLARKSASGAGLSVRAAKEASISAQSAIRLLVSTYNLKSLLDATAGGMEWQPLLLQVLLDDVPDFRYLGITAQESMVRLLAENFKKHANWIFEAKDLAVDSLPQGYDLLLAREALQGMSCRDAVSALQHIAESEARFVLISASEGTGRHQPGQVYSPDVRRPPFNLGDGVLRIFRDESPALRTKTIPRSLLLYDGKYLRKQSFDSMRQGCEEPG